MAETYDVYFGLPGNLVLISAAQKDTSIVVPYVLEYNTTYNWRVDASSVLGTTEGDVWSFTTAAFSPPLPSGQSIDAETGEITGTANGQNGIITVRRLVVAANNKVWYEQ